MTEEEIEFHTLGEAIDGASKGQLFGKPCYKIGGKAIVCFFENDMVFKLSGDTHAYALPLAGSQLFDPSIKHRPMKEWVQVPFTHREYWPEMAKAAAQYVSN